MEHRNGERSHIHNCYKGIEWAKPIKDILMGELSVEWEIKNNQYVLNIGIPVGCSATVTLPVAGKTRVNNEICSSETIYVENGIYQITYDTY